MLTRTLVLCLAALSAWAQPILTPTAASTRLYFAQLADGGSPSQKWTTTLLFVNPSTSTAATISVTFTGDNGQALPLDFGQGAKANLTVNLAAGGTSVLTSTGASSTTSIGWALAISNTPVLGTVIYRMIQNGTPALDVAATGSGATYQYNSFANPNLGVALVNPSATLTAHLQVAAKDLGGANSGTKAISLAPGGHTSFNLNQQISGLPGTFNGSITITSTDNPPVPFIAWTLNVRDNLLAPLPAGEMASPPPYDRRVYDVFGRLNGALAPFAQDIGQDPTAFISITQTQALQAINSIGLAVDAGTNINISYQSDRKVHVTQMALEALGNDEAAMAFLVMRAELMGYEAITGQTIGIVGTSTNGHELGLELASLLVLMKAGYDPGGAVDAIGRLWAASAEGVAVDSQLLSAFDIPAGVSLRLQYITMGLQQACGTTVGVTQDCQGIHAIWHPHLPSQVP